MEVKMSEILESEVTFELHTALAKAQAEMQPAEKDKKNQWGYYASLESCVKASRPALTKYGVAVIQAAVLDEATGLVRVTTKLCHAGQWMKSTLSAKPKDLSPQSVGSAVTYLRRYGYGPMVGLVTDEDDDGQAAQPTNKADDLNKSLQAVKAAQTKPSLAPASQDIPLPDEPGSSEAEFFEEDQTDNRDESAGQWPISFGDYKGKTLAQVGKANCAIYLAKLEKMAEQNGQRELTGPAAVFKRYYKAWTTGKHVSQVIA